MPCGLRGCGGGVSVEGAGTLAIVNGPSAAVLEEPTVRSGLVEFGEKARYLPGSTTPRPDALLAAHPASNAGLDRLEQAVRAGSELAGKGINVLLKVAQPALAGSDMDHLYGLTDDPEEMGLSDDSEIEGKDDSDLTVFGPRTKALLISRKETQAYDVREEDAFRPLAKAYGAAPHNTRVVKSGDGKEADAIAWLVDGCKSTEERVPILEAEKKELEAAIKAADKAGEKAEDIEAGCGEKGCDAMKRHYVLLPHKKIAAMKPRHLKRLKEVERLLENAANSTASSYDCKVTTAEDKLLLVLSGQADLSSITAEALLKNLAKGARVDILILGGYRSHTLDLSLPYTNKEAVKLSEELADKGEYPPSALKKKKGAKDEYIGSQAKVTLTKVIFEGSWDCPTRGLARVSGLLGSMTWAQVLSSIYNSGIGGESIEEFPVMEASYPLDPTGPPFNIETCLTEELDGVDATSSCDFETKVGAGRHCTTIECSGIAGEKPTNAEEVCSYTGGWVHLPGREQVACKTASDPRGPRRKCLMFVWDDEHDYGAGDVACAKRILEELGWGTKEDEDFKVIGEGVIWRSLTAMATVNEGLDWLIKGAQAGDQLMLLVIGTRVSQMKDDSGEEANKRDQVLIFLDGRMTDDELTQRVVKPLPKGVQFLKVSSLCKTGTLLDLPYHLDTRVAKLKDTQVLPKAPGQLPDWMQKKFKAEGDGPEVIALAPTADTDDCFYYERKDAEGRVVHEILLDLEEVVSESQQGDSWSTMLASLDNKLTESPVLRNTNSKLQVMATHPLELDSTFPFYVQAAGGTNGAMSLRGGNMVVRRVLVAPPLPKLLAMAAGRNPNPKPCPLEQADRIDKALREYRALLTPAGGQAEAGQAGPTLSLGDLRKGERSALRLVGGDKHASAKVKQAFLRTTELFFGPSANRPETIRLHAKGGGYDRVVADLQQARRAL